MQTMTEMDVRKIEYMTDLIGRTEEGEFKQARIDMLNNSISTMIRRGVSEVEILAQMIKSYDK